MHPPATAAQPARVLIVDDHPVVRQAVDQLLAGSGPFEVCARCGGVAEALAAVREHQPDLAVIDIGLPDGDGIELVKQIRAEQPGIGMLVLSMHEGKVYAERALRAGAMGYIGKDEAPDHLVYALERVAGGQVYLSGQLGDRVLRQMITDHHAGRASLSERLSDREMEIFQLIGQGQTTGQIAARLHRSAKTIETHREHIKQKLYLENSNELIREAVRWVTEHA